jgi:hypothetical protein
MRDLQDCHPYVQHLRIEHRRLNEALRRISGMFAESAKQTAIPSQLLVDTLVELRSELAHHFAEEESGGCLEEAVSRCPSLSPHAKEIEEQHPILLEALDCIIQQAQITSPRSATTISMQREFEKFVDILRQHESAEDRILQFGFGVASDPD